VAAKTRVTQFGRVAAEGRSQDTRRANSETGPLLDAPFFFFSASLKNCNQEVNGQSNKKRQCFDN